MRATEKTKLVEMMRRRIAAENERCAKLLEALHDKHDSRTECDERYALGFAAAEIRRTCPKE